MDNKLKLGDKAYEYVCKVVSTVGPRPAGSFAEREAFDMIAQHLTRFEYAPETRPVEFAPHAGFSWVNLTGGLLIIAAAYFAYFTPVLTIFTPLVVAAIPDFLRFEIRRRKRTGKSLNIFAGNMDVENYPQLIFTAHVDSSQTLPQKPEAAVFFDKRMMDIIQRVAILISISSIFKLLQFAFPDWYWIALLVIGTITGIGFIYLDLWRNSSIGIYSPGAIDNASGTGILLALAEYYAEHKPGNINIGFLFTGAEEAGLFGAREFADRVSTPGAKRIIFNLDMVGAGDKIQYVTRDGVVFPRFTSKYLNQILINSGPNIEPVAYLTRSGDYAPFLEKGIPAVSIQINGTPASRKAYHTINDKIDLVDSKTLGLVTRSIVNFVEMINIEDLNEVWFR